MGSSLQFRELWPFLRGTYQALPVRQPAHKNHLIGYDISHEGRVITFPFNNTCLSTECGMISFCLCI